MIKQLYYLFLLFITLPTTAQQDFEGIIEYQDRARAYAKAQVEHLRAEYPHSIGTANAVFYYRIYFKGNKIRVDQASVDTINPENMKFYLHEFIDLDRNFYYKFNFDKDKSSNIYNFKNLKENLEVQSLLTEFRREIEEVTVLEEDTEIEGRKAKLYRVRYRSPEHIQFVWVAKDAQAYPSAYPPIYYKYKSLQMKIEKVEQATEEEAERMKKKGISEDFDPNNEGRLFNDFSNYFNGLILRTEVSSAPLMKNSPEYIRKSLEIFEILELKHIEEKELPDSLFEIDLE